LFTAYTGAAASLFSGVTISKAAFLNQQKALSLNDKNEWQDVQIHIVDEVSFMSDKTLLTLDVKLKDIGNRTKPFVGFQSYLPETSASLNLLGQWISISCFQVYQANTGINASMQLLYWTMTIASTKIQSMDKCRKECGMVIHLLKTAKELIAESLDTMVFNCHHI
jgi:hypothetical protein